MRSTQALSRWRWSVGWEDETVALEPWVRMKRRRVSERAFSNSVDRGRERVRMEARTALSQGFADDETTKLPRPLLILGSAGTMDSHVNDVKHGGGGTITLEEQALLRSPISKEPRLTMV